MVKNKFDDLMVHDLQYKAHKVRSGIVMTNGMYVNGAKVVAIGTGTKCFADNSKDKNGIILHDMHAEVLARRSFVLFLYNQLLALVDSKFVTQQIEFTILKSPDFRETVNIFFKRRRHSIEIKCEIPFVCKYDTLW